ncbi:unnamed protein product [Closterium sp. Naga37s-1]|nr:unnamed protein product [Closterium sp. Naga37s-1]
MQGKQGAQYWKKLRRHLRKANPNWTRKSEAMKQQWKRLEKDYKEIGEALAMSGGGNVARPGWFTFMEDIRAGTAAVNPHVVDGGGAAQNDADPLTNPVPPAPAPATPSVSHGPQAGPSGLTVAEKAEPTPTPVRSRRVSESATIAGAKLIADTLRECNERGLAKLEAITRMIMSAVAAATTTPESAVQHTPLSTSYPRALPCLLIPWVGKSTPPRARLYPHLERVATLLKRMARHHHLILRGSSSLALAPQAVLHQLRDHVVEYDDAARSCTNSPKAALMPSP